MKNQTDDVPFSYKINVGHIAGNAVDVHVEASEAERRALAETWDVLSVEALSAEMQVNRWKRDGVRVKGKVHADIVQACVVTLEPVHQRIDEEFEQIFVPETSKLARRPASDGEMILDADGPDLPETFVGDKIDVGEAVMEVVALAIDPYPRKEGAEFGEHIEDDGSQDRKPSPFAALKDWKKD